VLPLVVRALQRIALLMWRMLLLPHTSAAAAAAAATAAAAAEPGTITLMQRAPPE
jgi:hypothetical protein